MITGIFIPADENQPIRYVEVDAEDVDAMQQIVGGKFEALNFSAPPAALFQNDDRRLLEIPFNRRATYLLWMHARHYRPTEVIGGDALLAGTPDGLGCTKSVPNDLVTLLLETETYRVEVLLTRESPWTADVLRFTNWSDAYEYGLTLLRLFPRLVDVRVVAA
jgi:hypothetical protein